jgi:predicted nucleic acid-binding protein
VTRLVVDASVLASVTFNEPGAEQWGQRLEGAAVFAPTLLRYELESVARKKCLKYPRRARQIVAALARGLDPENGITWIDPDPADVVLLAGVTGLTTYDAAYLCLAGQLGADLLTADKRLAAALDSSAA